MKKTLICSLLVLILPPCHAAPLGEGAFDTISISADEATEDEQPDILHFKGKFQMQSTDWKLTSDRATVYGSPEKPDKIYLEGSPARFLVTKTDDTNQDTIEAVALEVEYLREGSSLKLNGNAVLMLGDEIIRSTFIEYDIDSNRYQAGGTQGVYIEVSPVD